MSRALAVLAAAVSIVVQEVPKTAPRGRTAIPRDYAAWSRVANCESGGWRVLGYEYPDSLGINRTNYERFGGSPLPPTPGKSWVPMTARIVQIRVADRLIRAYGAAIPDQYGCGAW